MARPTKQGVDYFPLDVHLDDKFKFIEIKYGLEGFALLIKLMQKIYSYGYWYQWTEDEELLFADETRVDLEKVQGVVKESVNRGIFNQQIYESYNVLTSKGIQKRYKEAVRRRKDVEVIEEYLLIDDIYKVNDDINPSSSSQSDNKSTQSKVNKTKVKENNKYSTEFESFWKEYPRKIEKKKSFKSFKTALKNHSLDTILRGTKGYAQQVQKDGTETRFIKHASTFLNNDSFLDYLQRDKPKPQKEYVDPETERVDNLLRQHYGG